MIKKLLHSLAWMLICLIAHWQIAYALPSDWNVVEGNATFNQVDDSTLEINVSDQSIIEYGSFDIGLDETVNFIMPNADALALNRIVNNESTSILGNLFANGNLILVNEAGLHFGSQANVDVAGLIASTKNITNADFLNGNYIFGGIDNGAETGAMILNEGIIQAQEGGMAVLIADSIENRGVIKAPLGTVALAAGDQVSVGLSYDGLVSVYVDMITAKSVLDANGNPITDQIKNSGQLEAASGRVNLTAKAADQIFESAINLEGEVNADTLIVGEDGVIEFVASGSVVLEGDISADQGTVSIFAKGGQNELKNVESETLILKSYDEDATAYTLQDSASVNTHDIEIGSNTTLNAGDSSIQITGDWKNEGTFNGDESMVEFSGDDVSQILGSNRFNDFRVVTPQKVLQFDATQIQTIDGLWKIEGAYGEHVRLVSTNGGDQWSVNPLGDIDISYAWVEDSFNMSPTKIIMLESTNRGNSVRWDPVATWTNGNGTSIWSDELNWAGLGGATPGAGDDVVFDGTSDTASTIDGSFGGSIGSLSMNAGYNSTITMARSLTVTDDSGASGDMTMVSGGFRTASGSATALNVEGDLSMQTGTTLTVRASSLVGEGAGQTITVTGNLDVDSGAVITANSFGFAKNTGPGVAINSGGDSWGASHGGSGIVRSGAGAATYGSFTNPTSLGSGGIDQNTVTGGGAITLAVTGDADIDGTITANGGNASCCASSSGASGGSINISTGGTLTGDGIIRANGGTGNNVGGAGGRISFGGVTTNNFSGTVQAAGGSAGSNGERSYSGTIYFGADYDLVVGGAGNITSLTLGYDGTNNYDFSSITINSGGTLSMDGNPNVAGGEGSAATLNVETLDVQLGGILSADGLGFGGTFGPAGGTNNQGGGHGGQGADNANDTYGSLTNPVSLGSGGSTERDLRGGGAIIVNASEDVTVNGTITADGLGGGCCASSSAGAGGTINISADNLIGTGTIGANGGTTTKSRGGGGGRISIRLSEGDTFDVTTQAFGGGGNGSNEGAAGTIYLEGASDGAGGGELIINNSLNAAAADTQISSSMTDTTIGSLTLSGNADLDILSGATLTISGTGTTITAGANTSFDNHGILNLSGTDFTMSGSEDFSFMDSAVNFLGQSDDSAVSLIDTTYYDISVNNDGTTFSFSDDVDINDDLTITNGTFQDGGNTINLAGDLNNTGGTFTATGTTIFDGGDQAINGSNTFNDFTKSASSDTLTFEASETQTVTGQLTLAGIDADNRLSLRSSDSATHTQWLIDPQGARSVTFVDVQDSSNINGTRITTVGSLGSGNNVGWDFDTNSTFTWLGGALGSETDWGTGGNWSVGTVPGSEDSVVVTDVANDPLLDADRSVGTLVINSDGILDLENFNFTIVGAINSSGTLRLQGGQTVSIGTVTDIGNVEYDGSATYSSGLALGNTYTDNLTFSGTGTWLLDSGEGTLDVDGALNISNASAVVDLNGTNIDLTGGSFENAGTLRIEGTETFTNFTNDPNSGIIDYNTNSSLASLVLGSSYFGLAFSGSGSHTLAEALDVDGSLTVGAGFTLAAGSNGVAIGGDFTNTGTTTSTGTFTFDGATTQSINSGSLSYTNFTHTGNGTLTFESGTHTISNNLTIGNGTSTGTATSAVGSTINVTNNVTISENATFTAPSGTMTVGNNWNNSGGTFNHNNGTVQFTSNSTQTVTSGGSSFYDFDLSGTGTLTVIGERLTVANELEISNASGVVNLSGQGLTMTGADLNSIGTIRLRGTEDIVGLTAPGDVTKMGTFLYRGDGDNNADVISLHDFGATDFYNLTIQTADSNDTIRIEPGTATTVAGALTVSAGTFDVDSNLTVAGLATVGGGTYQLSGANTFNGGLTVDGGTLNASPGLLDVSGSTHAASRIDINGDLNIDSGSFTASAGELELSGDFNNSGGTFSHGSGTVVMDGTNQTIRGSNTFYNFEKIASAADTLFVEEGTTQTIANETTMLGLNLANRLSLRSTTQGTAWNITHNASALNSFVFLNVQDSNSTSQIDALASVEGAAGNTTNWNFVDSFVWNGGSSSWNTIGNWTFSDGAAATRVPGAADFAIIVETANDPTLDVAANIIGMEVLPNATVTLDGFDLSAPNLFSNRGTIQLQGDETITLNPAVEILGGTWEYLGDGVGGETNFVINDFGANDDYYNLIINASATDEIFSSNSTLNVRNSLTISNGTFDANGITTMAQGGVTVTGEGGLRGIYDASSTTGKQSMRGLVLEDDAQFLGNTASQVVDVNGSVTIRDSAVLSAPKSLEIVNNFSHSGGTFTHNSGTVLLNGLSQTISGSTTFNNLTKNSGDLATLSFEAGTTQTIVGDLNLTGSGFSDLLALKSTSDGSQWNIDTTGADSITLNFLSVKDSNNNPGAGNLPELSPTNSSDFGNNNGWNFPASSLFVWNGADDTTFANANNWNTGIVPGNGATVYIPGDEINQPIAEAALISFEDLFLTGGGTLDLNGFALTVTNTFSNAGTLKLRGNETVNLTQDTTDGRWLFVGDADGETDTYDLSNLFDTYYDLTVNFSDTTDILQLGEAVTINNDLSVASGTLDLNGFDISAAGDTSVVSTIQLQGTETAGLTVADSVSSGTWEFVGDGGGQNTISLANVPSNYYNVIIDASNTTDIFVPTEDMTINGTLTVTAGEYRSSTFDHTLGGLTTNGGTFTGGSGDIDVNGDIFISSGTLTAPTGDLSFTGNMTLDDENGTFNANGGSLKFDGNDSAFLTLEGATLNNVSVEGNAVLTTTVDVDIAANGSFIVSGGTFNLNGNNWTMGADATFSNTGTVRLQGNEVITNLTQDADSGTWEFLGDGNGLASDNNIGGTIPTSFFNVTFNSTDAGDTFILPNNLDVDGSYSLAAGTFRAPNTMAVAQDFSVTDGATFQHNDGLVTLDGITNATVDYVSNVNNPGTVTFFDLTIDNGLAGAKTVSFGARDTFVIASANTLTVSGAAAGAANRITLESTEPGVQWNVQPQDNGWNVSGVVVSDSNNLAASSIDPSNSVDGGGNTNWFSEIPGAAPPPTDVDVATCDGGECQPTELDFLIDQCKEEAAGSKKSEECLELQKKILKIDAPKILAQNQMRAATA